MPRLCLPVDEHDDTHVTGDNNRDEEMLAFLTPDHSRQPPHRHRSSSFDAGSQQQPGIASLLLSNPLLIGLPLPASAVYARGSLLAETLSGALGGGYGQGGSVASTSEDSIADPSGSSSALHQQHMLGGGGGGGRGQRRMSLDLPRACVHCSYMDSLLSSGGSRDCTPSPTFPPTPARHLSLPDNPATGSSLFPVNSNAPMTSLSTNSASKVPSLPCDTSDSGDTSEDDDIADDDKEEDGDISDLSPNLDKVSNMTSKSNTSSNVTSTESPVSTSNGDTSGNGVSCMANDEETGKRVDNDADEMTASFHQHFDLTSPQQKAAYRAKSLDVYGSRTTPAQLLLSSASSINVNGSLSPLHLSPLPSLLSSQGQINEGRREKQKEETATECEKAASCTTQQQENSNSQNNNNINNTSADYDCSSPDALAAAARKGRSHSLDIAIGVPFQAQANLR